jgi:hypothetical protein
MNIINQPNLILINGKVRSGKSYLTKYLIYDGYKNKRWDYIIVFTNTPSDYTYIDKRFVRFYEEKELKRVLAIHKQSYPNLHILIVFDDVLDSVKWGSNFIEGLITRFRHYNDTKVSLLITTQHINKLPPIIRANASYVVLFKIYTLNSLKAAYESYCSMLFNKIAEFKAFMELNTTDYNFIFLDMETKSNKIEDQIKILKAPDILPQFFIV